MSHSFSMKVKLTKAQIKLLDTEQKAHIKYTIDQDKRIKKLAKKFGLVDDEVIWSYIVNNDFWAIEQSDK